MVRCWVNVFNYKGVSLAAFKAARVWKSSGLISRARVTRVCAEYLLRIMGLTCYPMVQEGGRRGTIIIGNKTVWSPIRPVILRLVNKIWVKTHTIYWKLSLFRQEFKDSQDFLDIANKLGMSTVRCARLMAVGMANNLDETWISENPSLAITYISEYFPNFYRWYVFAYGLIRYIWTIRGGEGGVTAILRPHAHNFINILEHKTNKNTRKQRKKKKKEENCKRMKN